MRCFFGGGGDRSGIDVSDITRSFSGGAVLLFLALLKTGVGWDDLRRGGSEGGWTIGGFFRRGVARGFLVGGLAG